MEFEVIEVPFDGYGREGHQASAARALVEAGLHEHVGAVGTVTTDRLFLPQAKPTRGPHGGLLNEPALEEMASQVRSRVAAAVESARFPVVVGADCSILLGIVPGLQDVHGDAGLVVLDGHEDTMPLDVVEDGEAANCELGLLLGVTGQLLTGPLSDAVGILEASRLAVLGPRDVAWRRQFNVGSLSGIGCLVHELGAVRQDPAAAARDAAAHVRRSSPRWWLHVDLDVLDPEVFAAQGLPGVEDEPDGLDWDQLESVLTTLASAPGCAGLSVVIYDPAQDPDRQGASRIVAAIHRVLDVVGRAH